MRAAPCLGRIEETPDGIRGDVRILISFFTGNVFRLCCGVSKDALPYRWNLLNKRRTWINQKCTIQKFCHFAQDLVCKCLN